MATFKAIVITKNDAGQTAGLTDFDDKDLMEGDVTFRPEWSTVNYKDGLAVTGKAPVVRRFPMIAPRPAGPRRRPTSRSSAPPRSSTARSLPVRGGRSPRSGGR